MRYVKAFFQFWYDFIIGDDWTIAALVVAGLVVTWWLAHAGVPAWWLMPLVALGTLCLGVRRQSTKVGGESPFAASHARPVAARSIPGPSATPLAAFTKSATTSGCAGQRFGRLSVKSSKAVLTWAGASVVSMSNLTSLAIGSSMHPSQAIAANELPSKPRTKS